MDAFHEEALAAGGIMVVPDFVPSTIRATMRPSSLILMATTSKRSAMSQEKKPKPSSSYSPECVEGEFSEGHPQTMPIGRSTLPAVAPRIMDPS